MTRSIGYLTTTACLMLATTGMAQTGTDQRSTDAARTADTITCADIITMDTAVVPGVLYFVAGFQEGNKAGTDDSASGSSGASSDSASNGTATSGSTESASSDTGAAASGTTESTAKTNESDTTSDEEMRVMRVSGLYEIPVEKIMMVCNDTPEGKVGDIVKQHGDEGKKTSD